MSPLRKNKKPGGPRKEWQSNKRIAQEALNEDMRRRVWEMKIRGHSFPAIGRATGYSTSRVHEIYYEALAINRQLTKETVEDGLAADLAYLNHVQIINEARLTDTTLPNGKVRRALPRAVADAIRIMERRARYLGLDAPEKRELSGPGGSAIKSEVTVSFEDIDASLQAAEKNVENVQRLNGVHRGVNGSGDPDATQQ